MSAASRRQAAPPANDFDQMPTPGDLARSQAQVRGEAAALAFEGRTTTFAGFDRHTNQMAHAGRDRRVN